MKISAIVMSALLLLAVHPAWCAPAPIRFDFESGTEGWDIPEWAYEQKDCVCRTVSVTNSRASHGSSALALTVKYPGNVWSAAVVEYEKNLNLRGYKRITADIYVPRGAPADFLAARIVVTAGMPSLWIEMRRAVPLAIGRWTKIKASLDLSPTEELAFWRCRSNEQCVIANLGRVTKIAIRIEYNANAALAGPPYAGDIYIDNITIE